MAVDYGGLDDNHPRGKIITLLLLVLFGSSAVAKHLLDAPLF
jgi:hypothetical protein